MSPIIVVSLIAVKTILVLTTVYFATRHWGEGE